MEEAPGVHCRGCHQVLFNPAWLPYYICSFYFVHPVLLPLRHSGESSKLTVKTKCSGGHPDLRASRDTIETRVLK